MLVNNKAIPIELKYSSDVCKVTIIIIILLQGLYRYGAKIKMQYYIK